MSFHGAFRFNTGKRRWGLVPFKALEPMVEVLEYGAHKYSFFKKPDGTEVTGAEVTQEEAKELELVRSGADNWRGGLSWTECTESLLRHTYAFLQGEDNDPESKLTHVGHMACNTLFLSYLFLFRKDLDDRHRDSNFESPE